MMIITNTISKIVRVIDEFDSNPIHILLNQSFFALQSFIDLPPNGQRYRAGGELAGKTTRRKIRRWGRIALGGGNAPDRPVHAMLGRFLRLQNYQPQAKSRF